MFNNLRLQFWKYFVSVGPKFRQMKSPHYLLKHFRNMVHTYPTNLKFVQKSISVRFISYAKMICSKRRNISMNWIEVSKTSVCTNEPCVAMNNKKLKSFAEAASFVRILCMLQWDVLLKMNVTSIFFSSNELFQIDVNIGRKENWQKNRNGSEVKFFLSLKRFCVVFT